MGAAVYDALLTLHVLAGSFGLLLGPAAMLAPKRRGWHTRAGVAYLAAVALMTSSAVGLVASAPARLWGLGLIAVATAAAAATGWVVRRRHRPGWLPWHVRMMAGSYISFVTAALVVNWDSPIAWAAPTVVGSPLIVLAVHRVTPRRPRTHLGDEHPGRGRRVAGQGAPQRF